jgi:hypothetical protein
MYAVIIFAGISFGANNTQIIDCGVWDNCPKDESAVDMEDTWVSMEATWVSVDPSTTRAGEEAGIIVGGSTEIKYPHGILAGWVDCPSYTIAYDPFQNVGVFQCEKAKGPNLEEIRDSLYNALEFIPDPYDTHLKVDFYENCDPRCQLLRKVKRLDHQQELHREIKRLLIILDHYLDD